MLIPVDRDLKEFCRKLTMPLGIAAADATHASLTTQQHRTNDSSTSGKCSLTMTEDAAATEMEQDLPSEGLLQHATMK